MSKEPNLSDEVKKVGGPAVIDWVFSHLPPQSNGRSQLAAQQHQRMLEDARKTEPCPGAMSLLEHAMNHRKEFYDLWEKRIVRQQLENEQRMEDDGSSVLSLITRFRATAGFALQPGSEGNVKEPGMAGESDKVCKFF